MSTSAAVDIPPGADAQLRWPWLRHLQQLDAGLRSAGYCTAPDRWTNAGDLLSQLIEQDALPVQEAEVRDLLAPLFCQSAAEQEGFSALFSQWWRSCLKEDVQREPGRGQQNVPALAAHDPEHVQTVPGWLLFAQGRRFQALALLVLVCTFAPIAYYQYRNQTPVAQTVTAPQEQLTASTVADPGPVPDASDIKILPPQPRQPAESAIPPMPLPLDDKTRAVLEASRLMAYLVMPLLVLLLLARRLLLRISLRHSRLDPENPLANLFFHASKDDLFDGPAVRSALRRLHQPVALPTHRLDVRRTVDATVRRAGFFTPVQAVRAQVPEVMVWVNCRHPADPVLGLADTLAQRLRAMHLEVSLYAFRGNPDHLSPQVSRRGPLTQRTWRWLPMQQVLARHEGCRMILVGHGEGLVDLWSESPLPWLDRLRRERELMILAPNGTSGRIACSLRDAGVLLAPMTSAGIEWVSRRLTQGEQTTVDAASIQLPALLREVERLRRPVSPPVEQQQALLDCLRQYLGERGLQVLVAAAVYPQLLWSLVRALDLSLPGDGGVAQPDAQPPDVSAQREQRLLKLAHLPWARDGWMPGWVRLLLLNSIGRNQENRLRELYDKLLDQGAQKGIDNITLPIFYRRQASLALRARIREWIGRAERNSLMEDGVFADFMWGGLHSRLHFTLPRRLAGLLPRPGFFRRGLGFWISIVIAAAATYGLGTGWKQWGHPWLSSTLAGYDVTRPVDINIYYRFDMADASDGNAGAVAVALYKTVYGTDPDFADWAIYAPPVGYTKSDPSFVLYREGWQGPASWLAQRIAYSNYGAQPEIRLAQPQDQHLMDKPLLVWVNHVGTHGHPFRDTLQHPFDPTQWQAQREQLQKARAGESAGESTDDSKPSTVQRGRPFQDTLKDGSKGPVMLALPGGTFRMGSPDDEIGRLDFEGPQHKVSIAPFALGETEVTFADYDRFAKATSRKLPDDNDWGRDDRPVINVSWDDAMAYAQWLSEQTGYQYRLPSEAEWEYAARAGTTTPFSTGKCITADQANFNDSKSTSTQYADCPLSDKHPGKTQPVKRYDPNAFGLYDMHGNLWERTQDCWHDSYTNAPVDGSAWREANGGDCAIMVIRGGSWDDNPLFLRSAIRFRILTAGTIVNLGFRLARTL